ncbi:hypothetical protein ACL6C3_31405 [Capilliphycus salinus ALCB114379]|uniref:hypothetical protein n=1 Tax=Capilliphycus salinus TaxID=2768948 RepID=UPI0039A59E9E
MPLSELLSAVNQLSHQDKLRLIHFLLLAVAREEGCELESIETQDFQNLQTSTSASTRTVVDSNSEEQLLQQLASTEAVVWSPYEADEAAKTLADLLAKHREDNA